MIILPEYMSQSLAMWEVELRNLTAVDLVEQVT